MKWNERGITCRNGRWAAVVVVGLFNLIGGCVPDNLLSDLATSTAAAVWGELVFTGLDWVLPAVSP